MKAVKKNSRIRYNSARNKLQKTSFFTISSHAGRAGLFGSESFGVSGRGGVSVVRIVVHPRKEINAAGRLRHGRYGRERPDLVATRRTSPVEVPSHGQHRGNRNAAHDENQPEVLIR